MTNEELMRTVQNDPHAIPLERLLVYRLSREMQNIEIAQLEIAEAQHVQLECNLAQ